MLELISSYRNTIQKVNQLFKPIAEQINKFFINAIPSLESFSEIFVDIPEILKLTSKNLSDHGWFIIKDFNISDIHNIAELFSNNNFDEIDSYMCDYIEIRLEEIFELIYQRNQKRKHILQPALIAHKKSNYYLSIPVFYSQADGICNDLFGSVFFATKKPKKKEDPLQKLVPRVSKSIVKYSGSNSITKALVHPFNVITAISISENQKFNDTLNRHEILHGKDIEYGNKTNSLKAISFLYYISKTGYDLIYNYVSLLSSLSYEDAKQIVPELDKLLVSLGLSKEYFKRMSVDELAD